MSCFVLSKKDFKIGDEVFGMRDLKFWAHAEYASVKENSVISHKPHNALFEEAAALLSRGQAAHYLYCRGTFMR